ncbi:MAG: long-chain fatty acid--CoA ligase [Candidatus Aminicenantes bacterium]|nr:long-chain fatty acid--CoA ligase [Candidatus Aminicenantes bacterium]
MVETLSQIALHILSEYPAKSDLMQVKIDGRFVPISTEEFGRRLRRIALGLRSLGCGPDRKLVILSENRPEWTLVDFANLCLGGVTVPIYPTLVPAQIQYIISNSEAAVVVCSGPDLRRKFEVVRAELPGVEHAVTLEAEAPEGFLTLAAVMERGARLEAEDPGLFERTARSIKPEDLASIIYTSGTTGVPKGVMLTHRNFVSNILALDSQHDFNRSDSILSFLPLSHVLERMCTFAFIYKGASIGYAESVETVADNLIEVRPTIMVSVPRLFEKLYGKVMDNVLAGSPIKRKIFFWAAKTGRDWGRRSIEHQPIPAGLRFKRRLAHKLVFSKVLEKTGGRVKFFVSGGAPLAGDIGEFFFGLGLPIKEGYGLTETSPVVACNTFEHLRFGTVGPPIPGVSVRIAADGEILVQGPNVMRGYFKMEAETKEAMEGGWFHTGDIGHFDADGFLVITDRKKDLIVTAGGKNVAPQPIENLLKQNPYIATAVVVGGKRKFISALIVPDKEKIEAYARSAGIQAPGYTALLSDVRISRFLLAEIDKATPNLAPYEKIKKIVLLDREFEIEREELTPTLKVKRTLVEAKYKDLIDALYKD